MDNFLLVSTILAVCAIFAMAHLYLKRHKKAVEILIKYANPSDADVIIKKLDVGDWIDLRSAEDIDMKAGDFRLISLGVAMKLPKGYEAHVAPRSSTFMKFGVIQANSLGIIDNAYCGDEDIWKFPAIALRDTKIDTGDRICQFRIVRKQPKLNFVTVRRLDGESRGGFGSTGTR